MIHIYSNRAEIDEIQWDKLLNESSVATFFQTKECYDLYSSVSFLNPFIFGVAEDYVLKGIIVGFIVSDGVLVKKYFSRRAIIPGSLLLDSQISEEALTTLLNALTNTISQRSIYIEFRNYNSYEKFKKTFEVCGFKYHPHLNFHISTPSLDIALKNLSSTKRRDIKVSQKNDTVWFESESIEDLKNFYRILHNLYKTKIKTPLFDIEFFEKIISKPYSKFFVIKNKGVVVGGSICVTFKETVIYEWFVCGLDGKYKNVYPSTLATWAAIEYAANNGYSKFDMMGAGKPDEGYGVREFKAKFGGELVEHGRFIYVSKSLLFSIGKFFVTLLKKLK